MLQIFFRQFGDCDPPTSLTPLMLILYDLHPQNTLRYQVSSQLDVYSLSNHIFCLFLECAERVSKLYSAVLGYPTSKWYAVDAQSQHARSHTWLR